MQDQGVPYRARPCPTPPLTSLQCCHQVLVLAAVDTACALDTTAAITVTIIVHQPSASPVAAAAASASNARGRKQCLHAPWSCLPEANPHAPARGS